MPDYYVFFWLQIWLTEYYMMLFLYVNQKWVLFMIWKESSGKVDGSQYPESVQEY